MPSKYHPNLLVIKMASALTGLGFFLFALFLHWHAGTFQGEFGRYQDEGMHYVTGLMLHDFLLSPAHWTRPMAFAQDYYLHFPKVGLGNWPPLFPLIQAGWELMFGVSRVSLLLLMILLNALLAWCVQQALRHRVDPWLAALAGLFTIASPLSQAQASMVMAEIPLALLTLLALLAFTRWLDSGSTRDALWFGILTTAAIMTKGNAWVIFLVTPAALLLTGRLRLLLTRGWWLAIAIIALVCVPYTWYSMRIVTQGWDTRSFPGFTYLGRSLWTHSIFVVEIIGPILTAIALGGLIMRLRRSTSFWLVMGLYAIAIVGFHVAVPTSIEARKIYQIVPIIAIFAAAGLDPIARRLPIRYAPQAVALASLLIFVLGTFYFLPPFIPGFGVAVEKVIPRPDSAGAVILVSSNRFTEDAEAAIIAEWAQRDRTRHTYLARGTKLLSSPAAVNQQLDYVPVYQSPAELRTLLDQVPVAYVIVHTAALRLAQRPYRHHAQLALLLASHPEEWQTIHHSERQALGDLHDLIIYRNRRDLRGVPIHFTVDLSRKIGRDLSTNP